MRGLLPRQSNYRRMLECGDKSARLRECFRCTLVCERVSVCLTYSRLSFLSKLCIFFPLVAINPSD